MMYYCELFNEDEPYFPDYMHQAETDMLALMFFRNRHGPKLQLVYDENFRVVWSAE